MSRSAEFKSRPNKKRVFFWRPPKTLSSNNFEVRKAKLWSVNVNLWGKRAVKEGALQLWLATAIVCSAFFRRSHTKIDPKSLAKINGLDSKRSVTSNGGKLTSSSRHCFLSRSLGLSMKAKLPGLFLDSFT